MNIVYRTQPSDTQKAQQWLVSLIYLIGNSFYCLYSTFYCLYSTFYCLYSTFYCLYSTFYCLYSTFYCLYSTFYCLYSTFYCLYSKHVTFLKNQFYNTRKNISFQDCIKYKSTFTMLKLFVNLNFNNWQQIPLK